MDISSLPQLISTIGFPIVMCLSMLWYIKDITEKRNLEVEKFTNAINRNTIILQKLCDKFKFDLNIDESED